MIFLFHQISKAWQRWGRRHSTEEALALLTQPPWVWILVPPRFFSSTAYFDDSNERGRTHLALKAKYYKRVIVKIQVLSNCLVVFDVYLWYLIYFLLSNLGPTLIHPSALSKTVLVLSLTSGFRIWTYALLRNQVMLATGQHFELLKKWLFVVISSGHHCLLHLRNPLLSTRWWVWSQFCPQTKQ